MLPQRLTKPAGKEAELYRRLPNGRIQCTACARLCQIAEGQVGLCGVRGVVNDKLYLLVYGKIITGHIDPIEKKPVVHYRPGSKIFSVATTGCNWLCNYCFSPETAVLTDQGIRTIQGIFDESSQEAEIGYPSNDVRVLTHEGHFRKVLKVFRHPYSGDLLRIRPFYLPEVRCTPNHNVFVFNETTNTVEKRRADQLTTNDFLAVPKIKDGIVSANIDSINVLQSAIAKTKRRSVRKSVWNLWEKDSKILFRMSRSTGIPSKIPLTKEFAELLGIYCAEGSATKLKNRPNSWIVTFSFGSHERELIGETEDLLRTLFGVKVAHVRQGSELRLEVHNTPLAILLYSTCGGDKYTKRVPEFVLYHNSNDLLHSFLRGYIRGDGYATSHKKQAWMGTTSVSRELSLGVWYIMFRLHLLPRFYVAENSPSYEIEGRVVSRHNDYLTRVLLTRSEEGLTVAASKLRDSEGFVLVPIRVIERDTYKGSVYNMEVEGEHSYSASFIAVSNCQNFDISQRRKVEGVDASPADVAGMAESRGCEGMAYTYNQPTIFMEYARDIGRVAREKGIFNIFVSNGFDTPETVGMMKDFLDCMTVDFKGSGETGFVRRYIGIPSAEPIYQTLLETKRKTNVHIEITDLIVPEVGDNLDVARSLSRWVYDNLGPDTPIHFLRFHPDYKMMDLPWTPVQTLEKHYDVARKEGLRYVYIGNVPGHPKESTYCPECGRVLIGRYGYDILEYNLDKNSNCKFCGCRTPIVGPLSKSWRDDRFIPVVN
ncbi:MAG: AmmeMemoRadiSam system radical SAM enzyme [Thaumarchaeota archaeon]|nr:AmmeMemoRadiSam system radical SAM enzyme [Nitrososphaerota archaeon]